MRRLHIVAHRRECHLMWTKGWPKETALDYVFGVLCACIVLLTVNLMMEVASKMDRK